MSNCASIDPLVTPYVDGELGPSDRAIVEGHIGLCPPCRSRVAAERVVRDLLTDRKATFVSVCAPVMLRVQCEKARTAATSGAAATRRGFALRGRLAPLAAAASLVVIVGGAFLYQATAASPTLMAAELAADHVKCFAMNAVLGTHDTSEAVQSSMASSFGWNMHLPSGIDREALSLVGSRPCLYGEGKVAHIMYRQNGRPVSLFMLPRSARSTQTVEVLGHECAIWSAGDRTFVLVSRGARSEVERLAAVIRTALQ